MKYLYWLITVLFFAACHTPKQANVFQHKEAARILLQAHKMEKWQLVQSFDPYNGGTTNIQPKESPYFLELWDNGEFAEYEQDIHSKGKWQLNKDKTTLTFVYWIQTGTASPKKNRPTLSFQIRKKEGNTMILAILGRHGWVEKTYQLVSK